MQSPTVSLDARRFSLVTPGFVLGNRHRFAGSRIQIYRVMDKRDHFYEARLVSFEEVEASDGAVGNPWELAVPVGWGGDRSAEDAERLGDPDDAFSIRWNALMAQDMAERVHSLEAGRTAFEAPDTASSDPEVQAQKISQVAELAFLVNRASLSVNRTALTAEDLRLAQETIAIVESVIALIAESQEMKTLFQTLERLSNGQVMNHTVRVFTTMVSFLLYYNDQHRRGLNQRLRVLYPTRYRDLYRARIPSLRDSLNTFDNVVRLSQISVAQLKVFALGTLLHDIGKIFDLDYFETGAAYDIQRIHQHPILGSGLFQRTYGTQYEEARYIVGDHHNYLFHPEGYGLTRWDRARAGRPPGEIQCCIANTLDAFRGGHALGFFPVEVCAVVDIYDALTDGSRSYKKALGSAEALALMDRQFCRSQKLDPILLGLFVEFLKSVGTEVPPDLGLFG